MTARGEQGAGVVARSRWLQLAWALAAGAVAAPVVVFLARVDESFFAAELLLGSVVALFIVALTSGERAIRLGGSSSDGRWPGSASSATACT